MTPVNNRLESALRLFAAGICVCSVGLLSSLTVQSSATIPLPVVFFLVVSAGCAFIVFAGGLGSTTAGGLGGVIAVSISIAMANASEISPVAMSVFTMLTMTVMVVVGRIAGGARHELKNRALPTYDEPLRTNTRLLLDQDSPIWETTGQRPEMSSLMGLVTQDFCNWLSDPTNEIEIDEETEILETLLRLNNFVGGPLRQRLHARHAAVGMVNEAGEWSDVSAQMIDAVTIPPAALHKLAAEQPYLPESNTTDLASRAPQCIIPVPGKPMAAVCIFGMIGENITPRAARSLSDLVQLFNQHLRGLKALREARSSFNTLASSFALSNG